MGWTEQEQLVVAMEDGMIRMYNLNGEFTQFSLGKVRGLTTQSPTYCLHLTC
jgi:hypothetical protein